MTAKAKKNRWSSLLTIALGNSLDNADGGLINGLFPVIKSAFNLTDMSLGIFTSISRFSRMIFGPLWAMAADRWNRKTIFFIVTGIWGIWTILAGLATSYEQLLILYTIGSIGTVAAEPIATSLTSDLFPQNERGKAFGILRGLTGLGFIVFIPIIGLFSKSPDGWRSAMVLMGALSVFSGVLSLFFLHDPGRGAQDGIKGAGEHTFHLKDLTHLAKSPTFILMGVSLLFVTSLVMFAFSVTFLVDVRGFSNEKATYVLAAFAIGYVFSSFIGGLIGDWFAKKSPKYGRIVLMQIFLVVFALMSLLAMQVAWPAKWMYIPVFFTFGLVGSIGMTGAFLPMVTAVVEPHLRSSAFGFLFSLVQGGVTALLSLLVGWLSTQIGLMSTCFWVGTLPYLINAVLWFAFYKVYPIDHAKFEKRLENPEAS